MQIWIIIILLALLNILLLVRRYLYKKRLSKIKKKGIVISGSFNELFKPGLHKEFMDVYKDLEHKHREEK